MKKLEEGIQTALSTYVKLQYPKVIFTSESSGIRVGMKIAVLMKKQRCVYKLPDFMLFKAKGDFHGLFIELKKDRNTLYKKDGSFKKSDHIDRQIETINILKEDGYMAGFACGIDEARSIVDHYMGL